MSEIICKICNQPVSKRQSLAYQDGRACKSHSEVQDAAKSRIEEEERERIQKQKEHDQRRFHRHESVEIPPTPVCLCCRKEVISQQDHFLRMMIANEKVFQSGGTFLDSQKLAEAYGKDVPPVAIWFDPKGGIEHFPKGVQFMACLMEGKILVCYECAKQRGFGDEWKKQFAPNTKDLTFDQLANISAAMEVSGFSDVIKEVAKKEIEHEQRPSTPSN